MFVSFGQFYVFVACFALGGVSGVFLSLSQMVKFFVKKRFLGVLSDTAAFAFIAAVYIAASYAFGFPSLRAYMIAGVLLGIIAYMKSFHILLAKIVGMVYNKITKLFTSRTVKKHNDGRKTKKIDSGGRGRCRASGVDIAYGDGLSIDSDRGSVVA